MNWMSSGKNKLQIKQDQLKQREFFQNQRLKQLASSIPRGGMAGRGDHAVHDQDRGRHGGVARDGWPAADAPNRSFDLLYLAREPVRENDRGSGRIRKAFDIDPARSSSMRKPYQNDRHFAQYRTWSEGANYSQTERSTHYDPRDFDEETGNPVFERSEIGYRPEPERLEYSTSGFDRDDLPSKKRGPEAFEITADPSPRRPWKGAQSSPVDQRSERDVSPLVSQISKRNGSHYSFSSPAHKDRDSVAAAFDQRTNDLDQEQDRAGATRAELQTLEDGPPPVKQNPGRLPANDGARDDASRASRPSAHSRLGTSEKPNEKSATSPSVAFQPRTRRGRPLLLGSDGRMAAFWTTARVEARQATDLEPGDLDAMEPSARDPVVQVPAPDLQEIEAMKIVCFEVCSCWPWCFMPLLCRGLMHSRRRTKG
ncbi:hypothetical protein DFJ74DRAFT_653702 [Hyaloraphidium curvatum]|nr:hypothetical protein DFJ74DRAFT_653702 [Hyaloraphidium curvatum]